MTRPGGIGNRLLAALPPADFDLLAPELETVALHQDAVLSQAGDPIEHVFFPDSGAISLMIDMANGQTVATAAIGHEGAIGILSVLGPSPSAITAIVRAAGTASRIPASRFHAAFNRSPAIRHAVLIHFRAILIQFQLGGLQCAASGRSPHGTLAAQLRDRIDQTFPLTQETLSPIPVRATTVTLLMRKPSALGAIRSDRRGQIEVDRSRLARRPANATTPCVLEVEQIFDDPISRFAMPAAQY